MPILMLTAADRLDDKTSGFELGAGYRIDTQPGTGREGENRE
jgi:DNA-binding response OmpR family regulator